MKKYYWSASKHLKFKYVLIKGEIWFLAWEAVQDLKFPEGVKKVLETYVHQTNFKKKRVDNRYIFVVDQEGLYQLIMASRNRACIPIRKKIVEEFLNESD